MMKGFKVAQLLEIIENHKISTRLHYRLYFVDIENNSDNLDSFFYTYFLLLKCIFIIIKFNNRNLD